MAMAAWAMLTTWASPAAAECGDGVCVIEEEGCYSCPGDCGECPDGPGSSCSGLCGYNTESCYCDELCHPYADCCADVCLACPTLPGCSSDQCGNGACDEGESCYSCPGDCGDCNLCGDTFCGEQETCQSCPADCGPCEECGDGECVAAEDCYSCPPDCGYCPECGDGICGEMENCFACPDDCGECVGNCGDGECGANETCNTCAEDCGECCGDGTCDGGAGEDCVSCPEDCADSADSGPNSTSGCSTSRAVQHTTSRFSPRCLAASDTRIWFPSVRPVSAGGLSWRSMRSWPLPFGGRRMT